MMFALVTNSFLLVLFSYKCLGSRIDEQFYPYYHLAPPFGWMNDPNGFCVFKNEYHLFYQHNPVSSQEPGIAHWGHAKSSDLFHWEHLDIAMYPDTEYDRSGVFSGSAIINNGTMNLLYTGNVNHADGSYTQRQALAYSSDGVNIVKYFDNPVIVGRQYQPNLRDPKVWKHGNMFYMVLGNSFNNNTLGRVLLFKSEDLIDWQDVGTLDQSSGPLGYMWECPDFFKLDSKYVLLFSPQGVKPQGDKYRNLYQTGYIVGDFDYKSKMFIPITDFRELDHGHDFYATQTLLDRNNRRIVVAWFDMWEQVYPERNDGWTGQITIPRVLHLTPDFRIIQQPVVEARRLRTELLYNGEATSGHEIRLQDNAGEINIVTSLFKDFELIFEARNTTVTIYYNNMRGTISLDRGDQDGIRKTNWRPKGQLRMQIFVDRSSIELFCGMGEVTFSSRFFPLSEVTVRIGDDSDVNNMTVYSLARTVYAR